MQLSRIAIFGPGLIGGSLALAARRRGICAHLSLWSRDCAELAAARELGLAHAADTLTDDPAAAVAGADLVVLCLPPAALPGVARQLVPHLKTGVPVCDVASVKAGLSGELGAIFRQEPPPDGSRAWTSYVGAHPMAGGERSGPRAARADLFTGAVCLLTPEENTSPAALEAVEGFWTALGARVRRLTPAAHDETVAMISHLPHALAAALVHFVTAQAPAALPLAGPGWRDVTRIAAGAPELWTEILSRNRQPVTKALHGLIATLHEMSGYLEAGREEELQKFLSEARSQRERSEG